MFHEDGNLRLHGECSLLMFLLGHTPVAPRPAETLGLCMALHGIDAKSDSYFRSIGIYGSANTSPSWLRSIVLGQEY